MSESLWIEKLRRLCRLIHKGRQRINFVFEPTNSKVSEFETNLCHICVKRMKSSIAENVSRVNVFVDMPEPVNEIQRLKKIPSYRPHPACPIEIWHIEQVSQTERAPFNDDVKSVSPFKCLMHKRNAWVPEPEQRLKFPLPFLFYLFIGLIVWNQNFGD